MNDYRLLLNLIQQKIVVDPPITPEQALQTLVERQSDLVCLARSGRFSVLIGYSARSKEFIIRPIHGQMSVSLAEILQFGRTAYIVRRLSKVCSNQASRRGMAAM